MLRMKMIMKMKLKARKRPKPILKQRNGNEPSKKPYWSPNSVRNTHFDQ